MGTNKLLQRNKNALLKNTIEYLKYRYDYNQTFANKSNSSIK